MLVYRLAMCHMAMADWHAAISALTKAIQLGSADKTVVSCCYCMLFAGDAIRVLIPSNQS